MSGFDNHELVSEFSRMVVSQDVPRTDLARWDASARAWLQSADEAKLKEKIQLKLIIDNIQLPFPGGASMYTQVMNAWKHAMMGLERLIRGEPQEISNKAIMIAFSAWHLYPDLIVFGKETKQVKFQDQCVSSTGVCTIACEPRDTTGDYGSTWSLALSHLRYYGDPVIADSDRDSSRVTIQQLHIIVLGGIYHRWSIALQNQQQVAQWFIYLWDHLQRASSDSEGAKALKHIAWFRYLADAARTTMSPNTVLQSEALQLLGWGRRRAKIFLGAAWKGFPKLFGLGDPCLLAGLSEIYEYEFGVKYLRKRAELIGLCSSEAFIWTRYCVLDLPVRMYGILTAVPHTCASRKRDDQGNHLCKISHGKWLYVDRGRCALKPAESDRVEIELRKRLDEIACTGESAMEIPEAAISNFGDDLEFLRPPILYHCARNIHDLSCSKHNGGFCCPSFHAPPEQCHCLDYDHRNKLPISPPLVFRRNQRMGDFELCVISNIKKKLEFPDIGAPTSAEFCSHASPVNLAEYLHQSASASGDVCGLDACLGVIGQWRLNRLKDLTETENNSMECSGTLQALALATEIYLRLRGAMVSLKVLTKPLDDVGWFSQYKANHRRLRPRAVYCLPPLDRTEAFSCIFHFETGIQIEPCATFKSTLAIASGNSLFVLGCLLSDPFDVTFPNQSDIQRITGNIGRSGTALLVSPFDPKIRALSDQYTLVNHFPYDGERVKSFKSTSLHLSFTNWTIPVASEGTRTGLIDQDAYFLESVVSVLDAGKWVADLDVLSLLQVKINLLGSINQCPGHEDDNSRPDYMSIDSWEEFLDRPTEIAIFRAHGNWAARLAAASILCQQKQGSSCTLIRPGSFCFRCLAKEKASDKLKYISQSPDAMPSIIIDQREVPR